MVDISFTVVFQWLNFGILLFILTVLLYRPLLKFMDGRTQEIQDTLKEADGTKQEAEETLSQYKQKLAGAAEDARDILTDAKERGQKEKSRIVKEAEGEASNVLARARDTIELEERQARTRIQQEAVKLSLSAASRLLGRELDGKDQRRFVEDSIKELEQVDG